MIPDNDFVVIKLKNGKDYIFNKKLIESVEDVSTEDGQWVELYFVSKSTSTIPISIEDMKKRLNID